jgi:PAS domain S-box-containing protein
MLDSNGLITTWNPGAERFKGYKASEIIGQHFSVFYTDEDRQAGLPVRALETAAGSGRFESEGWRVRKDGTRFWASVVVAAVHDEKGALIGFAKVTRDITEKRALDEAREALFQVQKMESLGQLTGGIAHDFNNLLMAILSSLQLLRKRLPDERKINALIENAFQGAQRGVSLTQRMLAFAHRQELKLEPVALPALVHGMTDLMQRSLGPSITIEASFSLSLSTVLGDANQLESALLNLVVNARDAMPRGGTIAIAGREEIVTSSRNHLRDGRYVGIGHR